MKLGANMKALGKALLPPMFIELAARWRSTGCVWSGDYRSWGEAVADSSGYDAEAIVEQVKNAALKVKHGQAAYERDAVVFDHIEYSWPVLAGLMWIAARHGGRLDVLDFGGALGSSYFQNRHFLAQLQELHWSIVEQPRFVECGKRYFEDDRLRFYHSVDACLADRAPHAVLLSGVLSYLEKPYELLESLHGRFPFVIIDLTPVHDGPRDRLTVQTVPPSIYPARYPCWIFSEERLISLLKRHFTIVTAFDSHIGQDLRIGPLRARYRGFILEQRVEP